MYTSQHASSNVHSPLVFAGNPEKTITRHCPACGTDNTHEPAMPFSSAEWPMKQCSACDMVYLEKAWSVDVLYEEFAWEKSVEVEDKRRGEIRGAERKISKLLRKRLGLLPRKNAAKLIAQYAPAGNALDVGSGSGHHLMQLPNDYVPYGIEISTQAVRDGLPAIRARGGNLVNKDALGGMQTFKANFFVGIIMRSFLEHDNCPKDTLLEVQRILKPGGVVVIKVPNYGCINRIVMGKKWCGYRFPEHVNYFTPETLRNMLAHTGLAVKRFSMFDRLPTSDNMWLIAIKH